MKTILVLLVLVCGMPAFAQQPLIHAHNDYEKPQPLINALRNKVYTIEADMYPGDSLFVAHDKKDITAAKTLQGMYLQPMIQMFAAHNGYISDDTTYAPNLMIDIKENTAAVIPQLVALIASHRKVFDRSVNKHAVRIVLSGDRGNISNWNNYPPYIFFDGRPNENYDSIALSRVAFISDSYIHYIQPADSIDIKLQQLVHDTHIKGKLLRLWATPDNASGWIKLYNAGVDIINTDKPTECRAYFSAKEN